MISPPELQKPILRLLKQARRKKSPKHKVSLGQVWWYMPVIPALRRLRRTVRVQASLGYKVSQWYAIMLHSAVFLGTNDLFSGLSSLKDIRSLSIKDYCKLRVKYSNFSGSHFVQLAEGPAYRGPLNSMLLQMQRKLQSISMLKPRPAQACRDRSGGGYSGSQWL